MLKDNLQSICINGIIITQKVLTIELKNIKKQNNVHSYFKHFIENSDN